MNTITVNASKNYNVLIGSGLLSELGNYASETVKPCKAAVITDSNIAPLYGQTVENSLQNAGYQVIKFVFPAGEASKSAATYIEILNFLAENKMTRSDMIIALGGGVTGDMAGFAAATYLRGIAYIQVPTSLLAMVDSSVGGKTAIDLSVGKNLVGAFYQPRLVLCDTDALQTLPKDVFLDGCAEVIKYGVLYDPVLFDHLSERTLNFDREYVISRCVELKRDVVAQDEYDTGARQMLNLGHTFGHSIEARSNFGISHGFAVAIGMNMAAKAGCFLGICNTEAQSRIAAILKAFGLPDSTDYTSKELLDAALSDKKRFGGSINLVIPQKIGDCILRSTPVSQLESIIEAGL